MSEDGVEYISEIENIEKQPDTISRKTPPEIKFQKKSSQSSQSCDFLLVCYCLLKNLYYRALFDKFNSTLHAKILIKHFV